MKVPFYCTDRMSDSTRLPEQPQQSCWLFVGLVLIGTSFSHSFHLTVHPGTTSFTEPLKTLNGGQSISQMLEPLPGLTVLGEGTPGNPTQVSFYGLPNSGTNALYEGIVLNTQNAGGLNLTTFDLINLDSVDLITNSPNPFHHGVGTLSFQGIDLDRHHPHHFSAEISSLSSAHAHMSSILTTTRTKLGLTASGYLTPGLSQRMSIRQRGEGTPYQTHHLGIKATSQLNSAWQLRLVVDQKPHRLETDGVVLGPSPNSLIVGTLTLAKIELAYDAGTASTHRIWLGGYQDKNTYVYPPDRTTHTLQSLQIGHQLTHQTSHAQTTLITHYEGLSLKQAPGTQHSKSHARLFLEHLFPVTDGLHMILATTLENVSHHAAVLSPQGKITYCITPNWQWEIGVKRLHRFPSLIDKISIAGIQQQNPFLKPEKTTLLETTVSWKNSDVTTGLTLFHAQIQDALDTRLVGNALYQRVNGHLKSQGFILKASYHPAAFQLSASYTFTHLNKSLSLKLRSNQAKHKGQISLVYPLSSHWHLKNSLLLYGQRPSQLFHKTGPKAVKLAPYGLWQSRLTYAPNASITLYLEGKNLLDQRYERTAGYRTPGRSFHMGIHGRF